MDLGFVANIEQNNKASVYIGRKAVAMVMQLAVLDLSFIFVVRKQCSIR